MEKTRARGERHPPPDLGTGPIYQEETTINGREFILNVRQYHDGSPADIHIFLNDLVKGDQAIAFLLLKFSHMVSLGLQYGVPLQVIAENFIPHPDVEAYLSDEDESDLISRVFLWAFWILVDKHLPKGITLSLVPPTIIDASGKISRKPTLRVIKNPDKDD